MAFGVSVLSQYNTRLTPRENETEYSAVRIFGELLEGWGASEDHLTGSISAFFEHFRRKLRPSLESSTVLGKLAESDVPAGVLTDVQVSVNYVGNERKDIEGANAAGCRSVLLWRPASEEPI